MSKQQTGPEAGGFSYWVFVAFVVIVLYGSILPARAAGPDKSGFSILFDKLPVQQLVMFFYDQCEKRGLVFDPAINKLDEVLTMRTPKQSCAQLRGVVLDALQRAGVAIEAHGSYDVIRPSPKADERDAWRELIFRPRFRDATELAELAQIAVRKGQFAHHRRGVSIQPTSQNGVPENGTNGATVTAKQIDKLVFFGPVAEAAAVESLLSRLDVPSPQIEIRAGIYEYQSGKTEGSAINAAVKLFNSKLGISINGGAAGGSSLKLSLPSIDAVLSLLDEDSRFRYVARPKVLAKDGEAVRFFAGEDVRVVGAVLLDRNGNPIQSKETLSAGVTLEATPRIRGEVVDLVLYQAVSNFVATTNGDPSILKRDLRSRLVMQPGYVYAIGGLQSARRTESRQRFFGLPVGNGQDTSDTELLLLMSVTADENSI